MFYNTLNIEVRYRWWMDVWRVITIIGAGSMLGFAVNWLQTHRRPVAILRGCWWVTWCLVVVVNVMDQIGEPLVVWRLPLFFVGTAIGIAQFWMIRDH